MAYIRTEKLDNGKYRYIHQVNCSQCEQLYEKVEPNKKGRFRSFQFCSQLCKISWFQNQTQTDHQCNFCNMIYKKSPRFEQKFCSYECYWLWMKDNIQPPQTENRRLKSNSPEALEKRRRTNIERGLWLDPEMFVDGMCYKDYVDCIRTLTKSLRPLIYEKWDGFDYYDGEYIKDNFNLFHFTHGDFPSIDHKISCFKGFKNKWPPSKVCELENMVVTKKRLNSTKQQRDSNEFKLYLENKNANIL